MQGPVYAEFSSYTRAKPPPQQNDSCSIFRTSLWKTVTEVITRRLVSPEADPCSTSTPRPAAKPSPARASLLIAILGYPTHDLLESWS
jgi:hypothetical protein